MGPGWWALNKGCLFDL